MMKQTGRILPATLASLTLALLSSPQTFADVNMKDASFTQSLTDFEIEGFKFIRTYNSRSLHRGLFGFGWCTDMEKQLRFEGDASYLHDCANGSPVKVSAKKKKGIWIVKQNNEIQTYNLRGQLMSLQKPHQRKQSFKYSSEGIIDSIVVAPRLQFRLTTSPIGALIATVSRLKGPSPQRTWKYEYKGEDWVRLNSVTASYDDLHNLTELREEKLQTMITYDTGLDEVRSISLGSCTDLFQFAKFPEMQISSWQRLCNGELTISKNFTFEFTKNKEGKNILARLRIYDSQKKSWLTDASFNRTTGSALPKSAQGELNALEPPR